MKTRLNRIMRGGNVNGREGQRDRMYMFYVPNSAWHKCECVCARVALHTYSISHT